jgi:hypothetical protein
LSEPDEDAEDEDDEDVGAELVHMFEVGCYGHSPQFVLLERRD